MIIEVPDERLRRPTQAVRLPDPAVSQLLERMHTQLIAARAIGVAAPQVGVSLRLAIVQDAGRVIVLANPVVVRRRGTQAGWEACLSVPHLVGWVERPMDVTIEADDERGQRVRHRATGLLARALIHEIDHLEGRLYLDGLSADRLLDTREHPTPPAGFPR